MPDGGKAGEVDGGRLDGEAERDGQATPREKSTHFDEAGRSWPLPNANGFFFVDMDGDGWAEAVNPCLGCGQTFGTSDADAHWKLAWNDGKKFASATFGVPGLSFDAFARSGAEEFAVLDLDGDGKKDLFRRTAGTLARGSKKGFGPAAPWDIEAVGTKADDESDFYVDVDGDGRRDLLILRTGGYAKDGSGAYVEVARNTGSGVGDVERWHVKQPAQDGPFAVEAIDFDGDGRVDFVGPSKEGEGYALWKNNGTGFDAPKQFPFPSSCYCVDKNEGRHHELIDLDGDGRVDLVEPADARTFDKGTGLRYLEVWGLDEEQPYWKYYPNDGNGFAAQAVRWPVPKRRGVAAVEGFNGVSDTHATRSVAFLTTDFNGDGRPDLVDFESDANGLSENVTVYLGVP